MSTMRARVFVLLSSITLLSTSASAQAGVLAPAGSDLPLMGCIGAGIIFGGLISALKTRHQK